MAHRTRVLFLIPHLESGGAAQVTALLARNISRDRFEVHLGIVTRSSPESERLPAWVTIHTLGASRVRRAGLRIIGLVREVRPEVIVSGMAHLNFLVLLLRPLFPGPPRVLVRQNTTVSSVLRGGTEPFWTKFLYRALYPRAQGILCQSQAMAADLEATIGVPQHRVSVLSNPVDADGVRAAQGQASLWKGSGPHLLAVGRLAPEKGFDLLLVALARVKKDFPAADLTIAGSGEEGHPLRARCQSLGLEGCVHFAGQVSTPYSYFPGASLFVLPSRYEGMPNALLEAGIAGLPIVALPSSGGLVELLKQWPGAWIAENISAQALGEALVWALRQIHPGQRFQRLWDSSHAVEAYEQRIEAALAEGRA
jgi:glycosyltransferase involved in cell wall biosynthesis